MYYYIPITICALQQHSLYLLYDMHMRRILHSYRYTLYYNIIIVSDGFKTLVHKSKTIIHYIIYYTYPLCMRHFLLCSDDVNGSGNAPLQQEQQHNITIIIKKICTRPQHSPMKSLYNIMPPPDTRLRGYILCYMNRTTKKPSGKDRRDFCPAQCI